MRTAATINDHPLPYVQRLDRRPLAAINLLVVHCTELPDLATARTCGERRLYPDGTGNSGHYYIDRDGTAWRYVPDDRVAHHVRGCNDHSIGVELVNTGRYPDWLDSRRQTMVEPYPDAQIAALLDLIAGLRERIPSLRTIAGHAELDTDTVPASDNPSLAVRRRLDPGPRFPWPRVMAACGLRRLGASTPPV